MVAEGERRTPWAGFQGKQAENISKPRLITGVHVPVLRRTFDENLRIRKCELGELSLKSSNTAIQHRIQSLVSIEGTRFKV
ncbi:hypothetical protein Avbf_04532 [Armadillidium vulgare]|nr:hypothetical protein Avbf_04532 [Armadillidium vulgare]